jgi:putative membrane-bound dehydrogenase-like protein
MTPSSARHASLLAGLLVVPAAMVVLTAQRTGPAPAADVTLAPAEAKRLAAEARAKVPVEMPPGVELSVYAPEGLVAAPVAVKLDHDGTAYVASTTRANMPLDIREHPDWVPVVHTLRTVPDLLAFYRRDLAPHQSARNSWIPDANGDGSHDYRDFAEFKERVTRLHDADGDGVADQARVVFEGLNEEPVYDVIGGLLPYRGDIYVGSAPGVWRLRDTDRDGRFETQETISQGYGVHMAFGGHGISGVMMGPDGRLYWEVGDIGLDVTDKDGHRWSLPHQGAVMRSEPDGTGFEVFAAGIRNLQEFAFDEHGNLVSVDNDGDHQGETERLVYITEGSDTGWRSNWQYGKYTDPKNNGYNVWMDEQMYKPRMPGQAAYITPPVASYHTGPSGMVYNPGTALSDEWRRTFFVSSFPGAPAGARIYAFTLKEQGAGFALDKDVTFLRGVLTVGMDIGPDGALYITDWINGWSAGGTGRIWKLDTPAAANTPIRQEVARLLAQPFDATPVPDLSRLLAHADMRVRQKAQFELARRGEAQALAAAAASGEGLARIHGIWGTGQLARKDRAKAAPLVPLLKDADAEVRAQAAKTLGDVRYAPAGDALVALLADPAPRARFFAAEALGRLAYAPAVAPIVRMLADNDDADAYLRHAGALALARIGDVPAIAALSSHPSRGVRLAAVVALRRLRQPLVARFLEDADPAVVTEAARAINDDGSIAPALPALAALLGTPKASGDPLVRRAISASLKVADAASLARVAAYAGEASHPEAMRVEAIETLGVWAAPSPMDRVDGFYLDAGVQNATRDAEAARAALLPLITSAGSNASPAVKIALAVAAGQLELEAAAPTLLAQLKSDPSPEVRIASLRALQAVHADTIQQAMDLAVADARPEVRRAALELLPSLDLSDAARADHLKAVIAGGNVEDQQAGYQVLGTLKSPEAASVLGGFLDDLAAGRVPPAAQLDLVDAAQTNGAPELTAKLEAYQKAKGADSLLAAFRPALLAGGSAYKGRGVFFDHPAAQCTRCHSLRAGGSDVGPNLGTVGARLSTEQILQSLLEPSAEIAPGFGTVGVTLRDGSRVDGQLKEETPQELVLVTGTPAAERRIPKAQIASRTDPVSPMPPMGALLKPREIRDLVAFLSSLR